MSHVEFVVRLKYKNEEIILNEDLPLLYLIESIQKGSMNEILDRNVSLKSTLYKSVKDQNTFK